MLFQYQKKLTDVYKFSEQITKQLEELEKTFGYNAISKLGAIISCTEYGLTETEYLELLMPTSNIEGFIRLNEANFNFSSLCSVRRKMGKFSNENKTHSF